MIRTDRGVSGQEAQSMGLANRLVPKGQALDSGETREGATRFARGADRHGSFERKAMAIGLSSKSEVLVPS